MATKPPTSYRLQHETSSKPPLQPQLRRIVFLLTIFGGMKLRWLWYVMNVYEIVNGCEIMEFGGCEIEMFMGCSWDVVCGMFKWKVG